MSVLSYIFFLYPTDSCQSEELTDSDYSGNYDDNEYDDTKQTTVPIDKLSSAKADESSTGPIPTEVAEITAKPVIATTTETATMTVTLPEPITSLEPIPTGIKLMIIKPSPLCPLF